MKTIIFCATALTMTGATMAAGSDWTTLDREVEALSSSLAPQEGGVAIGGFINLVYANSGDLGPDDVSAFGSDNIRLTLSGENSGFRYTIDYQLLGQEEFATDPITGDPAHHGHSKEGNLVDAYISTDLAGMTATGGWFKAPAGASGGRAARDQFYATRSAIGNNFAGRDAGVMLSGSASNVNWAVAIQNGSDGVTDEYRTALHANYTVMGSPSSVEGCYGAADGMSVAIGASMLDDGNQEESATIFDASLTSATFSFSVELADTSGSVLGVDGFTGPDSSTGQGGAMNVNYVPIGEDPMALSATYAIGSDWEIGIRHQDLGADTDETILSIAVNHYVSGHDVKWTIQMDSFESEFFDTETEVITIGLQLGF